MKTHKQVIDDLLTDREFYEYYYHGDPNGKLGFELEIMRAKSGITQKELAHRMGTKQESIARAENTGCSFAFLMRAAKELGKYVEVEIKSLPRIRN